MVFDTERLIIREFKDEDIDLIFDINNDPECIKFNGWNSMSLHECHEVLEKWIQQYSKNPNSGVFCIESKHDNSKIGMAFIVKTKTYGEFEIGFRLRRIQWDKGFAKEVTRGFLNYSKYVLIANSLIAEVYTENIRSRNIFKKLGFEESSHPDGENGLIYRFEL
ncbi:MAG: GCN5-related N-acetyltransferase [Bacillales bacterium]|jgi:RimJ/RimL family protein N-acetyltransferase|nr:GCN5-related N-acetyltransferase [Bacillales bacterium]